MSFSGTGQLRVAPLVIQNLFLLSGGKALRARRVPYSQAASSFPFNSLASRNESTFSSPCRTSGESGTLKGLRW